MTELNQANLGSLTIPVPSYDRSQVKVGIVHFGVGGFHRAHQAMYIDQLMEQGKALDWGICGVGVMPFDLRMKEAMQSQDCLYTLVLKARDGSWEPRILGSIVQYLYAPDDPDAVIEKMADPATRIVSLTVTEGGYNFHPVTGRVRRHQPGCPGRPGSRSSPGHNVRPDHRSTRAATLTWYRALHRHVMRQHPGQRSHGAGSLRRVRPAPRPGAGRMGGGKSSISQLHGRPDHPGHHG